MVDSPRLAAPREAAGSAFREPGALRSFTDVSRTIRANTSILEADSETQKDRQRPSKRIRRKVDSLALTPPSLSPSSSSTLTSVTRQCRLAASVTSASPSQREQSRHRSSFKIYEPSSSDEDDDEWPSRGSASSRFTDAETTGENTVRHLCYPAMGRKTMLTSKPHATDAPPSSRFVRLSPHTPSPASSPAYHLKQIVYLAHPALSQLQHTRAPLAAFAPSFAAAHEQLTRLGRLGSRALARARRPRHGRQSASRATSTAEQPERNDRRFRL